MADRRSKGRVVVDDARTDHRRAIFAEFLGAAGLLFVIVGSGIALEEATSDGGIVLVGHGLAVGIGLGVLIVSLLPVSGAHFNPAVTLGMVLDGAFERRLASWFIAAQLVGAVAGVTVAHGMFGMVLVDFSVQSRDGFGLVASEAIVTFGLVFLIVGLVRTNRTSAIPVAVGAWIVVIVIATPSGGFANPAVTIARAFTTTMTGIAPASVLAFILAQLVGGASGAVVARYVFHAGSASW